jgi:hypothetical protein
VHDGADRGAAGADGDRAGREPLQAKFAGWLWLAQPSGVGEVALFVCPCHAVPL